MEHETEYHAKVVAMSRDYIRVVVIVGKFVPFGRAKTPLSEPF